MAARAECHAISLDANASQLHNDDMSISRRPLLALPALLALPGLARAQDRPLRLVVASAAGANADVVARLIAAEAEPLFGRRILVENIPAASGMRAVETVARAEPDGETLLFGTASQLVMNLAMFENPPVDVERAIRGITLVNRVPMVLAVPGKDPAQNLAEFVGRLRMGGAAQYGSGPIGTTTHVVGARFVQERGLARGDLVHVPYQSSAIALTDLMAGRLTFMFDAALTALPHHRAGRLRILGVAAERRLPAAPELPTLIEAGLTGFTGSTWNTIAASSALPEAAVTRLADRFNTALARPELRQRLVELGSELPGEPLSPAQVDGFFAEERRIWLPLLRATPLRG
jgi:tripartite-type tricarboxylate transporter receptor subunit TctC